MPKLKPLTRLCDGIPIIEAKEPLSIEVLAVDKIGADRKNPMKCVFAKACNRLFDGIASFYKHVAYVELPDKTGKRKSYVNRFRLKAEATRHIIEYDLTGRFKPGITIELLPPPATNALEYLRQQKHLDKRGPNMKKYAKRKPMRFDTSVRNGTGSLNMSNFHTDSDGDT